MDATNTNGIDLLALINSPEFAAEVAAETAKAEAAEAATRARVAIVEVPRRLGNNPIAYAVTLDGARVDGVSYYSKARALEVAETTRLNRLYGRNLCTLPSGHAGPCDND